MPIRSITSSANPEIRHIKALRDRRDVRHAERLFIVEGPRFVRDAARSCPPVKLLLSETALVEWDSASDADFETIIVPDELFATVSATQSPQGVLGIFPIPDHEPVRPTPILTVIADGIQDPGNLGAMLRSAAATGASQVLYSPGSVDPYNPKVVRAAAGAQFHLAIGMSSDLESDLAGSAIYIAESGGGVEIDQVDWTLPSSLIVGSEAHGPGQASRAMAATRITIPMVSGIESLNAGVAASIILYEAFRQRRRHHLS